HVPGPPVLSSLSLHDALPILPMGTSSQGGLRTGSAGILPALERANARRIAAGTAALLLTGRQVAVSRRKRPEDGRALFERQRFGDRKSTRLNSSHLVISYAVS